MPLMEDQLTVLGFMNLRAFVPFLHRTLEKAYYLDVHNHTDLDELRGNGIAYLTCKS